jgi:hypothetical protein
MDYQLVEKFIEAIKIQERLIARCHSMVKLMMNSKDDLNISLKINTPIQKKDKVLEPEPENFYPIWFIPGGAEVQKELQSLKNRPQYSSHGFDDCHLPNEAAIIMLNQVLIFYNKQLNQTKKELDTYLKGCLVKKSKQVSE